jgi:hypothetical protein
VRAVIADDLGGIEGSGLLLETAHAVVPSMPETARGQDLTA